MRRRRAALLAGGLLIGLLHGGCAQKEPPLPDIPARPAALMPPELTAWRPPQAVDEPPPPPVVPPPRVAPPAPNEKLYDYTPHTEYEVPVQVGTPADVWLEPGEKMRHTICGDRSLVEEGHPRLWEAHPTESEHELQERPHVLFIATQPGAKQGCVITTTRRTYLLTVKAVAKTPVRVVRFVYPPGPPKPMPPAPPRLVPDPLTPQSYVVGYRLCPGDTGCPETAHPTIPDWRPEWVGELGGKLYLLFPPTIPYKAVPLVREIGPQGPQVLNSRQVNLSRVLIIDTLPARLELRLGTEESAQVMQIFQGDLTRIQCPGDPQCPVWPTRGGR